MRKATGTPLKAQLSRSWAMVFVPLALIGMASIISLLALQAGLAGAAAGIALVGLSSCVTTCLVQRYPKQGTMSAISGWLKLLNVGVEIWREMTGQTNRPLPLPNSSSLTASQRAIEILDLVPGMTAAHPRDFQQALAVARLKDGTMLRTWKNPVGFDHVFLANPSNQMIYGGYVGWIHSGGFQKAIVEIKRELT